MRLLIVTQAVDRNDPVLGFFHRWIEEFAKRCESVVVICLFEGAHALPDNVRVHSLGKEKGKESRFTYAKRFWRLIGNLRKEYDSVFVHMNPEYVVLGSLLWMAWGKRVGLWYVHKSVTPTLRIATLLINRVFTASKESFRLSTSKVEVIGHGIDTEFFAPDTSVVRERHLLSAGRLSPSKRHDLIIRAAALAARDLRIAGEGPERARLEALAESLDCKTEFLGGISQEQLRDEYRNAAYLIHTSETGSLDKVVLEALATDTAVITTSHVFASLPVQIVAATPEDIARCFKRSPDTYDRASVIREYHSLPRAIARILSYYG